MKPNFLAQALLVLFFLNALGGAAFGEWPPERRRSFEERAENVYLAIPAIASMPGVGVFAGGLASVSNILGTGVDTAVSLAQSIDGSEISVAVYAFREIPTGLKGLKIDYYGGEINFGNFQSYLPGRNSPNFTIPFTGNFRIHMLNPVYRAWKRRINLGYLVGYFDGFGVDGEGVESRMGSHSAMGSIRLDFSDDVVDPHRGFRFNYATSMKPPKSSIFGKDSTGDGGFFDDSPGVRTQQFQVTAYFPLLKNWVLAWDNQYFAGLGGDEATGVISGGNIPMRSYPMNRWTDRFGVTTAVEVRRTIPMNKKLDFLLVRGTLDGLQLAGFYEVGQVNDTRNKDLYSGLHRGFGGGVRALIDAIVLRLDIAVGSEGPQFHMIIDQPF